MISSFLFKKDMKFSGKKKATITCRHSEAMVSINSLVNFYPKATLNIY